MARNLTDRYIATLKPTKKRQHIFDSQVPGLCLRVSPKGKKTFTLVVRRGKQQIWREVNGDGRYGILSLEEAREAAREGRKRIKAGEIEPFPKPEFKPEPESCCLPRRRMGTVYRHPRWPGVAVDRRGCKWHCWRHVRLAYPE